ncbi:MAG: DUF6516 family protein [Anaerolineae bacterium]
MNPLQSLDEYELFIYALLQHYPAVHRSTLVVIRRGAGVAAVRGDLEFARGIRLGVREKLSAAEHSFVIEGYSYEVWRGDELLYWYDSQPHPNEASLASTHPHHKHVPPDIKHNRIPAPGLSFTSPNLPFLIEEIERDLIRGDIEAGRGSRPA